MTTAVVCTSLLGLLLFVMGSYVSMMRGKTETVGGVNQDPADPLYKAVRAHGNTAEYAPMAALLILYLGTQGPAIWVLWVMGIVTACRYSIAIGILMSPTLDKPHPLRFIGALGTYIGGVALVVAAMLTIM